MNPIETFKFPNVVRKTRVGDVEVSTIGRPAHPGYFETVVFDHPDYAGDLNPQWIYDSEVAALVHHEQLADAIRKGEPLPDERNTDA